MERGDNVVLGNMCENLPHEMVPITKFSAFSSWTTTLTDLTSDIIFCVGGVFEAKHYTLVIK